ncbi:protein HEXIM1 [Cephus cinctus]|uniref:Protein HEXIM1 n=1 Tax=Cephus cinctus TaxID=211228 RepID=A0AAJ7FDY0_CEPCN|nr:protein HEXIM1 [Cephus cinctus]
MDECKVDVTVVKPSNGGDSIRDVKGVETDPMPAAESATEAPILDLPLATATSISRATAKITDSCSRIDIENKDCPKRFIRTAGKIESGSGSGDQEGGQLDDSGDIAAKKRKTRRGKPKHRKLKPYSKQQLSYQQRLRCRASGRLTKTGRQPPAPYNTTQFLMEDHSDLPDLEQKLAGATTSEMPASFQKPPPPPRTRDSSFSVDSDEDYFYSSPEDEEEFLTKEFSSAYEDLHAERLGTLTKSELIQEYVQLEAKVDLLTKRLRGKNFHQMEERDSENKNGSTTDSEIAKKLKICQQRMDDLIQQNDQLRRENETLRAQRRTSIMSSVDSESDSDSISNGNRSACSCSLRTPELSPVSIVYQARREKPQRKTSPESSVDSESDSASSSTNDSSCSCPNGSPGTPTASSELTNGHATAHEIIGLPT